VDAEPDPGGEPAGGAPVAVLVGAPVDAGDGEFSTVWLAMGSWPPPGDPGTIGGADSGGDPAPVPSVEPGSGSGGSGRGPDGTAASPEPEPEPEPQPAPEPQPEPE